MYIFPIWLILYINFAIFLLTRIFSFHLKYWKTQYENYSNLFERLLFFGIPLYNLIILISWQSTKQPTKQLIRISVFNLYYLNFIIYYGPIICQCNVINVITIIKRIFITRSLNTPLLEGSIKKGTKQILKKFGRIKLGI